ncbi:MAG TPA: NAD(P)H-binding protein [Noviherbaspirillum sp.]|nr:NAD(P)H-binding protein [Noviherbaspirillum sp.]
MSRILVVGASGTVGTELVKKLRAQGHDVVRATSQAHPQPDQVHLNLVTHEGLDQAFQGVDKAFFLCPPGHTNQHELLGPLIDQARERQLQKVVLMTAMGANAVESAPLRQAEIRLEQSGLRYNIIRPNWFMQNFNTFWLHGILDANTVFLPVGEAKVSFIDVRDIASVAAELLGTDRFDNQDFDLTGNESLSHDQAAAVIAQASGRPVRFQDITPQAMLDGLLKAGLPADYAEFLVMILGFLKQGAAERRTDAVEKITGKAPLSFAQYAHDYRAAWA